MIYKRYLTNIMKLLMSQEDLVLISELRDSLCLGKYSCNQQHHNRREHDVRSEQKYKQRLLILSKKALTNFIYIYIFFDIMQYVLIIFSSPPLSAHSASLHTQHSVHFCFGLENIKSNLNCLNIFGSLAFQWSVVNLSGVILCY